MAHRNSCSEYILSRDKGKRAKVTLFSTFPVTLQVPDKRKKRNSATINGPQDWAKRSNSSPASKWSSFPFGPGHQSETKKRTSSSPAQSPRPHDLLAVEEMEWLVPAASHASLHKAAQRDHSSPAQIQSLDAVRPPQRTEYFILERARAMAVGNGETGAAEVEKG